jgi:hypothetical protein
MQVLTPIDRAGLLDDAFALGYAGQLDMMVAMNFSIFLVMERHYIPWEAAINWFYRFDGILSLTPYYGNYRVSGCQSSLWKLQGEWVGQSSLWKLQQSIG